jgi:hypothetical protein
MLHKLKARAQRQLGQTMMFGLGGAWLAIMADLPEWLARIERTGIDAFLYRWPREVLTICFAGLVIAFALRLCTDSATALLQRPGKFLGMLAGAACGATLASWSLHVIIGGTRHATIGDVPLEKLFDFWLQAILWGGLTGWLYLVSLQRSEDRQRLSLLLGTRALLARQLAAAELERSRAHFDPAMVSATLKEVRQYYRDDPAAANDKLDELVADLRRAMKRRRSTDGGQ